jgi:hypothetical protein
MIACSLRLKGVYDISARAIPGVGQPPIALHIGITKYAILLVYHTSFEDNRNAYYIFEFQILSQFMLN